MTSDRTNISMDDEAFERLKEHKGEDDSWTDVAHRAADALEATETEGQDDEGDVRVLTEEHIDDIAARTADRTASEVENRLQTR